MSRIRLIHIDACGSDAVWFLHGIHGRDLMQSIGPMVSTGSSSPVPAAASACGFASKAKPADVRANRRQFARR
jgi:hypothetical protein